MDEVDKIIFHSLRKIGCIIGDEILSLNQFKPELLVKAASLCLQNIRPYGNALPRTLPQNTAQRFIVATAIAEACIAAGYRSDIGYHTFLYPNNVEVRRLFMFLIERLSKYNSLQNDKRLLTANTKTNVHRMQEDFKYLILHDLTQAWVPSFCGIFNQTEIWISNLNLSIKAYGDTLNMFQHRMDDRSSNLSCTVLHKNTTESHFQCMLSGKLTNVSLTPTCQKNSRNSIIKEKSDAKILDPIKNLELIIISLQHSKDNILSECQEFNSKITSCKKLQENMKSTIEDFKIFYKIKQRTLVVLENPEKNLAKLETLVSNTKTRRKQIEQHWKDYREPLLAQLEQLKYIMEQNNMLTVEELQSTKALLEKKLLGKRTEQATLNDDLKNAQSSIVNSINREEYMRRLKELSGNIRKQQIDVCKVLEDMRDIQKQINIVEAQLQRQFSYTDDLLFQTAQCDAQSKRSYQLLITLHASCTKLVELTLLSGSISKQVRELKILIDREKDKDVTSSLVKISSDILNINNAIKCIQTDIIIEENKITKG